MYVCIYISMHAIQNLILEKWKKIGGETRLLNKFYFEFFFPRNKIKHIFVIVLKKHVTSNEKQVTSNEKQVTQPLTNGT